MANMITGILSLTVGLVLLANVFIFTVKNTSTTLWTPAEKTMWSLLTLVGIVGLVYGVLNVFGLA